MSKSMQFEGGLLLRKAEDVWCKELLFMCLLLTTVTSTQNSSPATGAMITEISEKKTDQGSKSSIGESNVLTTVKTDPYFAKSSAPNSATALDFSTKPFQNVLAPSYKVDFGAALVLVETETLSPFLNRESNSDTQFLDKMAATSSFQTEVFNNYMDPSSDVLKIQSHSEISLPPIQRDIMKDISVTDLFEDSDIDAVQNMSQGVNDNTKNTFLSDQLLSESLSHNFSSSAAFSAKGKTNDILWNSSTVPASEYDTVTVLSTSLFSEVCSSTEYTLSLQLTTFRTEYSEMLTVFPVNYSTLSLVKPGTFVPALSMLFQSSSTVTSLDPSQAENYTSTLSASFSSATEETLGSDAVDQSLLVSSPDSFISTTKLCAHPGHNSTVLEPSTAESFLGISSFGEEYNSNKTYFHSLTEIVSHSSTLNQMTPNTKSANSTSTMSVSFSSIAHLHSFLTPAFTTVLEFHTLFSNMVQTPSEFATYTTGDSSQNETSFQNGYFPSNLTALEVTSVKTSGNTSELSISSTPKGSTVGQLIGPTQAEPIVISTAVVDSVFNSTSASYFEPTEIAPASNDKKEWAVPVSICLSGLLLVTLITLIIVCHRSRSRRVDSRHGQDHEAGDTEQAEVEQWQTQSSTPFSVSSSLPRYETQAAQIMEKQRSRFDENFDEKDADISFGNHRNGGHQVTTSTSTNKEIVELDNMPSRARERKDYRERYNPQSSNQEFSTENEALRYDNRSYNSNYSESSDSFLEPFHDSSMPAYRTSEFMNDVPYSAHHKKHMHFRPSTTSNQAYKSEPSNETTIIKDKDYYARVDKSVHPLNNQNYDDHKENKPNDATQVRHQYYNKGYKHDDHSNESGWNGDRKYITGEHEDVQHTAITNSDDDSIINADLDSVDNTCQNTATKRSRPAGNKTGISKCISFDETQLRVTQGKLGVFNKKMSSARKISTKSESATSSLSIPHEGFMNMASAYETMENLAEIGDSPAGSRFFIGSFSDNINLLGNSSKKLDEQVNSGTLDSIGDTAEHTGKGYLKDIATENISVVKNNKDTDNQVGKPKDDYIFPIVRKANLKIMAERQHRKLMEESNDGHSNDDKRSLATIHPWRSTIGDGTMSQTDVHTRELKGIKDSPLPPSSPISVAASTTSSSRAPHPSKIPTIVLTRDEDEVKGGNKNNDDQQSTAAKPPRIRRIARANNPFLIEVDSPAASLSEKVRRSSAPAMARSLDSANDALTKDRMIRSASGDHLCLSSNYELNDLFGLYPSRSWSSEFFDVIRNSQSGNLSDDERLKKMIDDRYNALFRNKYHQLTSSSISNKLSYHQDLSPRIMKLISSPSHKLLSQDATGNSDYSRIAEMSGTETRSRFRPILEVCNSEFPRPFYGEMSTTSDRDRNSVWGFTNLRMENNTQTEPATDAVENLSEGSEHMKSISEINQNFLSSYEPLHSGNSPRASLTHGTDGLDSDSEEKIKADFVSSWLRNTEPTESQPRQRKHGRNVKNFNTIRKVPLSNTEWESFDDDFEIGRLTSSKPVSEIAFTSEGSKGGSYAVPRIPGYKSHDRAQEGQSFLSSDTSVYIKQDHQVSLPIQEMFTEGKGEKVTGKYYSRNVADGSVSFTRSSFLPDTPTVELESEATATSHAEVSSSRAFSGVKEGNFDRNFGINIYNKVDKAKVINEVESNHTLENQSLQEQDQTKPLTVHEKNEITPTSNTSIPPEKPQRRAGKRVLANDRFQRLPSPYSLKDRKDAQASNDQKEQSRTEGNFHSRWVTSFNHNSTENTPVAKPRVSLLKRREGLASRSLSLNETSGPNERRPQRAITLETDKLTSRFTGFSEWSKVLSEEESRFVSSANNTLLEHTGLEDASYGGISISEPKTDLASESKAPSLKPAKKDKDQNRNKAFILDDDYDDSVQISFI